MKQGDGALHPDGRSTRWDTHRAARRAELVTAARRAVHRLGPGVSMEEIAAAADTSKSIFYRYFEDKASLRQAVATAVVADMHDALVAAAGAAKSPVAGLRAMVHVYLKMIDQSPNVYWYVSQTSLFGGGPDQSSSAQNLSTYLDSVIDVVAKPYAQLSKVPAEVAEAWAAGAVGFVRGAGEWWLASRAANAKTSIDRKALADHIALWLWRGPVGVLPSDNAQPSSYK